MVSGEVDVVDVVVGSTPEVCVVSVVVEPLSLLPTPVVSLEFTVSLTPVVSGSFGQAVASKANGKRTKEGVSVRRVWYICAQFRARCSAEAPD